MFQLDMNATFKILKILEKSKLKSEEVFTKIPGVVMIISGEGRVLKGNSYLSEILGCYSDELHTKGLADILTEENYKLFFKNLETTTDTAAGRNFETKLTIAGDSSLKILAGTFLFLLLSKTEVLILILLSEGTSLTFELFKKNWLMQIKTLKKK